MRKPIRWCLAAASVFLACGEMNDGSSDAGPTYYAFASGTFGVTNAVATTADQCGLLSAYTDPTKKIGVTLTNGTALTFNLSNDAAAAANSLPKAVLNGNAIDQPTEANYTVAFGSTCVVRVRRTVTGDVVADNTAALTLAFNVATETGTCSGSNTSFTAVPCASVYQFTATKQ